ATSSHGAGGAGGAATSASSASSTGGGSATCADGVKNGQETGVDCGGAGCLPCPLGEPCQTDGDCLSKDCQGSVCAMPHDPSCGPVEAGPTCADCIQNGLETDVDCGGDSC